MPIYTLTLLYVSIGMVLVFKSVRKIENGLEQFSLASYRPHATTASRSRRVMVQGILYSSVILFNILFPLIAVGFISRKVNLTWYNVIELIFVIVVPLHGFFNALMYLMPRVLNRIRIRRRRLNRDVRRLRHNAPTQRLSSASLMNRIRFKFIAMKNYWFVDRLRNNRNREDFNESRLGEIEEQSKSKSDYVEEMKKEEEDTDKNARLSNMNFSEIDQLDKEGNDDDDENSYLDDYLELIIK